MVRQTSNHRQWHLLFEAKQILRTIVVTIPWQQYRGNSTVATVPWQQYHGNSTVATVPRQQYHGNSTVATVPWQQYRGNSTMATVPWQQYHGNSTMATVPWQQYHGNSTTVLTIEAEQVLLSIVDLHGVHGGQVVQPDEAKGQVLRVDQFYM